MGGSCGERVVMGGWMGGGLYGGWVFVLFVKVLLVAGWLVDWMGNGFLGGWMDFLDFGFESFGRGGVGRDFEFFTRVGFFSNRGFIIMT